MPTRYDKEFKQNIINLYKQGESAAQQNPLDASGIFKTLILISS
ncbi:hypothetical protein [Pediococcus pentosaceus]|nr:hypothetical protein [Pediococcus pentosaceus]MDD1388536.1 hypothetical protein [Pediococcus pentosaceus]